jgi:hypothetical protein
LWVAGSCAESQIIQLSAGTAARRRATRAQAARLASEIDWLRLAEQLHGRRLLPRLGPRIVELAGGRAEDGFLDVLERASDNARHQGAFLQLMVGQLTGALADAGIRSTPLKGPFLSEALYGDPGCRLASDIDLLVAPEQLSMAVEVVRGFGYGVPTDHVEARGLPLLHFALVHERGELPPVELHWRIHWYERDFARQRLLPPEWTANQPFTPAAHVRERITRGGHVYAGYTPAAWRPLPVHELAALLLFYARDGFVDLRLASDLGAWWDRFGADLSRGALGELACAYPKLARALVAAAVAADEVVGLPSDFLLGGTLRPDLRGRAAVRLANPNPRSSRSQLHADMGLIDGLLLPRGGFAAFWRRQVLLPREVLEDRAGREQGPARSPWSHSARVLARYGLAVTRLPRVADRPW